MAEPATDAKPLKGQKVACAGRLASLTRAEIAGLVVAAGGEWFPFVRPQTSMLVVGQAGLPLGQDGRLARDLQKARRLQETNPITILTEADFLARLGLNSSSTTGQRLSTVELGRVLQVSGARIRSWVRLGLVQPTDTVQGIHYFDFHQVSWAKTLCNFARAGISTRRIQKSLQQLKVWLPDMAQPLCQLAVLEKDGKLVVRLDEGQLAEPTGQGILDFGEGSSPMTVPVAPGPQTDDQWFQHGLEKEQAGDLHAAANAYRQTLLLGGADADASFNLANVLYALEKKEQAAERYRQAVEIDSRFSEAWNNLGNVLAELGQCEDAVAALRKALEINPFYMDAHYNLADVLEQMGKGQEARLHWQACWKNAPASPEGKYAKQRLESVQG
jgi:tetratricopeptide (TPR) repeat protein